MKTVIAALLLLASTSSFAQYGSSRKIDESRTIINGHSDRDYDRGGRYDDRYLSSYERDRLIQRIREDYSWKIRNVYSHRYMRPAQKRREVRMLEHQRDQRIREVNARFYNQRKGYDNRSRNRW